MMTVICSQYGRYSPGEDQKDTSIEGQLRICREFADSKGWVILDDHIYADRSISGRALAPRDELKRLLDVASSGRAPFTYILVDETSRIARNTREALEIFECLKSKGIHIYYVGQGIDTAHETAETMITVHALVDSIQLKCISHETHRGIEGRVQEGFSGGGRHYGYRSRPQYSGEKDRYGNLEISRYKLEIEPVEAETVYLIFYLYAVEKMSAKQIASYLNQSLEKIGSPKPPRGKYWLASTILGSKRHFRGILNNELYIGKYMWNRTSSDTDHRGKKIIKINPPDRWTTVEIPELRIIPLTLWKAVKDRQRELSDKGRSGMSKVKKTYSPHLLTRIAKCGTCGGTIAIVSGGKYRKYGCTTNWNGGACPNAIRLHADFVEESIIALLCKELSQKKPIGLLTNEIRVSIHNLLHATLTGRQKEEIEMEHDSALNELANIEQAIRAGVITDTTLKMLVEAENREKSLRNELTLHAYGSIDDINLTTLITEKDLQNYFSKVIESLGNPLTTREAFYSIVDSITLHCQGNDLIDIEINEKTSKIVSYVIDLLGRRDPRIKMQLRTELHLYTRRIFKLRLLKNPSIVDAILDGNTVMLI